MKNNFIRSSVILLLVLVSCLNDDSEPRFSSTNVEGVVLEPIFCMTEHGPVFKIALKERITVKGGEDLQ